MGAGQTKPMDLKDLKQKVEANMAAQKASQPQPVIAGQGSLLQRVQAKVEADKAASQPQAMLAASQPQAMLAANIPMTTTSQPQAMLAENTPLTTSAQPQPAMTGQASMMEITPQTTESVSISNNTLEVNQRKKVLYDISGGSVNELCNSIKLNTETFCNNHNSDMTIKSLIITIICLILFIIYIISKNNINYY